MENERPRLWRVNIYRSNAEKALQEAARTQDAKAKESWLRVASNWAQLADLIERVPD
jgi:hypothetical protein